jgi:hypothetical protein
MEREREVGARLMLINGYLEEILEALTACTMVEKACLLLALHII